MTRQLHAGEFFGVADARRAVGGIAISRLQPTVPAEQLEVHTHEDAHFVFVRSGQYLSSAERAPEVCDSTSLIYNPPGTRHRDRFRELSGASFLTISFAVSKLSEVCEELELPSYAVWRRSAWFFPNLMKLDVELSRWNETSALVAEAACIELLMDVAGTTESRHRSEPAWLNRVMERLEDANEVPTIGEIAREAGVHPVHLARTFREFHRCSPGEYLRRRRLFSAAQLVAGTERPLADIAADCGYVDQSHFSNEFKRRAGVSPREYRRLSGRGCH